MGCARETNRWAGRHHVVRQQPTGFGSCVFFIVDELELGRANATTSMLATSVVCDDWNQYIYLFESQLQSS
jgi:hypothetical protein